jgi:hypothetical protein
MSAIAHLLATDDPDLLRAWWTLVGPGRPILTLNDANLPGALLPPQVPMVVVVDEATVEKLPRACRNCPTIFVGNPESAVFQQLPQFGRTRICLSHEDSRKRLGEFLPLLEELAERGASLELVAERARRAEALRTPAPDPVFSAAAPDVWEFFDGLIENSTSREHVLREFRRATRRFLRASTTLFLLREDNGFRADQGELTCSFDDPVVHYLAAHPGLLDGVDWPYPPEPSIEFAVRHRLATWGARLLVPLHENGRLVGIMGLGVREDGRAYEAVDRMRAISLARLLRQMLAQSAQFGGLSRPGGLHFDKPIPGLLVLAPDEMVPTHVPPAVAALIAEARHHRTSAQLAPTPEKPIRAGASFIAETFGTWAWWEDATGEMQEQLRRQRAERLALLHDLALTLNHELGNSLVSLAALRHNPGAETNSPVLLAAIKRDIASLESINRQLASIPTFSEVQPEPVDLRVLLHSVGRKTGVFVETGPDPIELSVAPKLIEFGLESIIESIAENRPGLGKRNLVLQLRASGQNGAITALLTVRGASLALEGILPAPAPGAVPSHGRIGVFIAKEIIRLHGGTIEAGAGMDGPEIWITVHNW